MQQGDADKRPTHSLGKQKVDGRTFKEVVLQGEGIKNAKNVDPKGKDIGGIVKTTGMYNDCRKRVESNEKRTLVVYREVNGELVEQLE